MPLTKVSYSMITGAVYNVLDYGADPTGATSSTAAIQAAINAAAATVGTPLAQASGGGVVYFPTGVYLSGSLTITSPFVSLQGDGPTASQIKSSGVFNPLLKVSGGTTSAPANYNMFIRDMKFIGGGSANNILMIQNIALWHVQNCWFEGDDSTVTTVALLSALVGSFENCLIRAGTSYGVHISQESGYVAEPNLITFNTCNVYSSLTFGLYADGTTQLALNNCSFELCGNVNDTSHGGVHITNSSPLGVGPGAVLRGCWFESNIGVNVRVSERVYSPGATYLHECNAVGTGVTYGLYVATPSSGKRSTAYIYDSNFSNATTRDIFYDTGSAGNVTNTVYSTILFSSTSANAFPYSSGYSLSSAELQSFGSNILTDNSATPSVTRAGLYLASNSSSTSITNFTDGVEGQVLMINATNGNTTLVNSASLRLAGATNKTMATRDVIQLTRQSSVWYQMSYSKN
jgi:hypothetical protein